MATISLSHVTKRYGTLNAMDDVTLKVNDGDFLVLLGPSGCGKTTTLRSIAGLERVEEGDILIDDLRVNDLRPADRDMAFCFQQYALYPHFNSFDNIAFPLRTQHMANDEISRRVNSVADVLEIKDIFKKKPKQLSSGDQQRVALARAMVRQPKVYLMDEPLSNLDAKLRESMRGVLRRLQIENKTTTVYVTHDQVEAMAMADHIAIMNKGKLQQIGSPDEVYTYPANLFVANFIGTPSMNFISCVLDQSSHEFVIDTGAEKYRLSIPAVFRKGTAELADGSEMIIGVRPEDVLMSLEHETNQIQLNLRLIEALGNETLFDLENGPVHIRSRKEPSVRFELGANIWTSFNTKRMTLFTADTGMAIAQEGKND
jgi:multiple sugar transport system ATP-binding protein